MAKRNQKNTKPPIRTMIVSIMALGFVLMFVLLYLIYNTSMQKFLIERENDNIHSQVLLAESTLLSSVNYLPGITRDWSSSDKTYNYVTGDYDDFLDTLIGDYPFQLFNLNFMTILSLEGDILYEQFYNYNESKFVAEKIDLNNLYQKIHPLVLSTFLENEPLDPSRTSPIGKSGFVMHDGQVYFMSAYPIIRSDETGPCVGTFIFGRIIDKTEISSLTKNSGILFSILSSDTLSLTEEQQETLRSDHSLIATDSNRVVAYGAIKDIFDRSDILISFESPRSLYHEGKHFIRIMLLMLAAGCTAVLYGIIKMLSRFIVGPLGSLVKEVNGINMDTLNTDLHDRSQNLELDELTKAINSMLRRIRTSRDIIDRNRKELTLHANYDVLTGLYNRQSAKNILEKEIQLARKHGGSITIFFFDLDRFKFINDTLGHSAGDGFIIALATRMQDNFRSGEILARMGGDEFVVIVRNLPENTRRKYVEERINSQFDMPFQVRDEELLAGASVGSSSYPEDGHNAEVLIKNAEIAMFRAKEMGAGLYVPYQRELQAAMQQKIHIENTIRNAVHDDCRGFLIYFQPKIDIASGEISGCEALIRWQSDNRIMSPDEFIPQAEESGLILPISWWLIEETCKFGSMFQKKGVDCSISINVSAQVLLHEDFLPVLTASAQKAGLDYHKLDIEIVEATLIQDIGKVNGILNKLHQLGVMVSVDDFGTGYSSLSYLNKLAVDRIKIDRSFVSRIVVNQDDQAIIRAIVAMARSLRMTITAEGVEEEAQYQFLKDINCDEIQGFFISRPLPGDDFVRFAKHWQAHLHNHPDGEICPVY